MNRTITLNTIHGTTHRESGLAVICVINSAISLWFFAPSRHPNVYGLVGDIFAGIGGGLRNDGCQIICQHIGPFGSFVAHCTEPPHQELAAFPRPC